MSRPVEWDAHVEALRAASGESPQGRETLERILQSVRRRGRRRRGARLTLLCAGLAFMTGTTAYAATVGPAEALHRVKVLVGLAEPRVEGATVRWPAATQSDPPTSETTTAAAMVDGAPDSRADAAPETEAIPEAPTRAATTAPAPARRGRRTPGTLATRPQPAQRAPVERVDPSQRLYAEAHRLHFVEGRFGAALDAWERYIAHAPTPTLLPEAQYNRALCLVRLGRHDEAIVQLTPFAEGAHHGYRQRPASRLIARLVRAD